MTGPLGYMGRSSSECYIIQWTFEHCYHDYKEAIVIFCFLPQVVRDELLGSPRPQPQNWPADILPANCHPNWIRPLCPRSDPVHLPPPLVRTCCHHRPCDRDGPATHRSYRLAECSGGGEPERSPAVGGPGAGLHVPAAVAHLLYLMTCPSLAEVYDTLNLLCIFLSVNLLRGVIIPCGHRWSYFVMLLCEGREQHDFINQWTWHFIFYMKCNTLMWLLAHSHFHNSRAPQ